jgi:hypothetical protein
MRRSRDKHIRGGLSQYGHCLECQPSRFHRPETSAHAGLSLILGYGAMIPFMGAAAGAAPGDNEAIVQLPT